MKKIFFLILFLSFCFLKPLKVIAFEPLDLTINEIAWMGTEKSYSDEWIEIYNNSSVEIDIIGWKIKSLNSKFYIELSGKITPKEFFILERTDDQSLPDIPADLVYRGALSNSGEHIELLDNENQIIDEINCEKGWFAGNNETKQTMERKNSLNPGNDKNNWQHSGIPGGTPKKESFIELNETDYRENDQKEEANGEKQALAPTIYSTSYFSLVYINELLPSPTGPDKENEWIELFNEGDDLNLSGWQIRDVSGRTQSYYFSQETIIKNNDFLILPSSLTKITLNNEGDSVLLINPAGETIDSVSFGKTPQGKSYNKTNNEWVWTSSPTPGKQNFLSDSKKEDYNASSVIVSSSETKEPEAVPEIKGLASVYHSFPKFNFSFILLIAFSLSFFSGILFILFKKRLFI